jgi:CubicO group peptidase (beta-lactamase class C family)
MDLAQTLTPYVESGVVSGAAALIGRGTEIVDVAVLGTPAFGVAEPLRRDAIFRIASVTKPIVAVLAMQLVDDGTVRLYDSVEPLLPELADRRVLRAIDAPLDDTVPAERSITLEDLLSCRFGFGFSPELPFTGATPIQQAEAALELRTLGPPWPPSPIDNGEWMRRLGTLPLMAQPGSTWMYNTGVHVAGVLLERAAGVALEDLLRQRLLEPLGIVDTGFSVPPDQVHRLTTFYGTGRSGDVEMIDPGDASSWWAAPPARPDASGGLVSTLDDLWAFARMMAAGGRHGSDRRISPSSFELLTTNRLTDAQRRASSLFVGEGGWGLGMGTPVDGAGSFGWDGGTGTSLRTQPSSGATVILLTQRAAESPEPSKLYADVWSCAWGQSH